MHALILAALSLLPVAPDRPTVVIFLGTQCPLARLYAERLNELHVQYAERGIEFVAINSNEDDSAADVAAFADEFQLRFPFVKDEQQLARTFGARRQLEVFLVDRKGAVQYAGRVDDQYQPGKRLPQPTRADLQLALDDMLAGRPIAVPRTQVTGCFLNLPAEETKAANTQITYGEHIAPLLARHCVACHSPGQSGPFTLTSYADAAAWAATIRERVDTGLMPPWSADPRFGHFANERRLSDEEKRWLHAWIDGGLALGPAVNPPSLPASKWSIGEPDWIVRMPQPYHVPATGVVEYQHIEVDPHLPCDVWVTAAEVLPGNPSVVHHSSVFLAPAGSPAESVADTGPLQSYVLATYVPGQVGASYPPGMAKRIPAGSVIRFVMHYTPSGQPAQDQTQLGLKFAIRPPDMEVATKLLVDLDFKIPPGAGNFVVERSWQAEQPVLLLSMFPHMHLRGKSMTYFAEFPGGRSEILLSVPHYDFQWQHRYVLAEPRLLPAGTVIRARAEYDNSASNPVNPDPSQTVSVGQQSNDEMFNAYFDVAAPLDDESRRTPAPLAGTLGVIGCWLAVRRTRPRS